MKKLTLLLSILIFTAILISCGGGGDQESKIIKLPDPPTDLKYLVEDNGDVEMDVESDPIGTWTGKFDKETILLVIESNADGVATGFNEVGGNRRVLTGTCIEEAEYFTMVMKEPGDHKWDGVFTFTIDKDHKGANGSWTMNKGSMETAFNLEKDESSSMEKVDNRSNIEGDLSAYMSAIPGEYLFEMKKHEDEFVPGYNEKIKVKFKFTKPIDVPAGTAYNRYGPEITAMALDEDGNPLQFSLSTGANGELATYLKRGSGEEWLTFSVSGQGSIRTKEDATKLLEKYKKGKRLQFNSEIVTEEVDPDGDSDSDNSSSSGDCDAFLDDYEDFMDDYIDILQDYQDDPTNTALISQYQTMMSKASTWTSNAANCSADKEFASRILDIQMKIAKAASEL
jgi:hypothetical protein